MIFGGYRSVWLLTMFDLPVVTKQQRKEYAKFRKFLLGDGYVFMQYSVYGRHCPSEERAEVHVARLRAHLPPQGEVRVLKFTDKQFERMLRFYGPMKKKPEKPPEQLTLFQISPQS